MDRRWLLPKFSMGGFVESVGTGMEERARAESEKQREQERIEARKRKKREEETAFWTTPGLRPLAEPPILDWEWFFRTHIPSDLRFKALFPNDPEKRCSVKDLNGEQAALAEYTSWAWITGDDSEIDGIRQEFYNNLYNDLYEDWQEVANEYVETTLMATDLSYFEFLRLDNDGQTTRLEQWIEKGADIFYRREDEVRKKYQHLIPSDFVENRLATFEFDWLDGDGNTTKIQRQLKDGHDILADWAQEVQDKYGHLRYLLPSPASPSTATPLPAASFKWEDSDLEDIQSKDDLPEQLEDSLNMRQQWASTWQ